MNVNNNPHCPMCGSTFTTPVIRDGFVRCPECDTPMFQYRYPGDENMTPKQFMSSLHPRANDAIGQCYDWFTGSGIIRSGKAAAYVMRLWPALATVFTKEEA